MSNLKWTLYKRGVELAIDFCNVNGLVLPTFATNLNESYGLYEYSRAKKTGTIYCNVLSCSPPCSEFGRAWSYPGYTADRTSYGVVCHELGHHFHFGVNVRDAIVEFRHVLKCERAVTSYAETNTSEGIAEAFRLFLTNPDLLRRAYPLQYAFFSTTYQLVQVVVQPWDVVLANAPARVVQAARNKLRVP
jgi:hypothetical protein